MEVFILLGLRGVVWVSVVDSGFMGAEWWQIAENLRAGLSERFRKMGGTSR